MGHADALTRGTCMKPMIASAFMAIIAVTSG